MLASLLLTIFIYLVFPTLYTLIFGKVPKVKAKKMCLVNSIVCCAFFVLLRLILTDGMFGFISFGPAVFYYFIAVLIMGKKENVENNHQNRSSNNQYNNYNYGYNNSNMDNFNSFNTSNYSKNYDDVVEVESDDEIYNEELYKQKEFVHELKNIVANYQEKVNRLFSGEIVEFTDFEVLFGAINLESFYDNLPYGIFKKVLNQYMKIKNKKNFNIPMPYNYEDYCAKAFYFQRYFSKYSNYYVDKEGKIVLPLKKVNTNLSDNDVINRKD